MEVTKVPKKIVTVIEPKRSMTVDKEKYRQKRVAAYCRVSTDSEEQLVSYTNQKKVYTEMIASRKDWCFAGLFADEGKSGTRADKRPEFNKMINDCLAGKIDYIITKSVSRFARNTVDCLDYVRMLKSKGIGVYFEEQQIDTLKTDSELYLVIYAGFAQSESESISKNITWSVRKKFEEGTPVFMYKRFLGYKKGADGEPEIVPSEVAIHGNHERRPDTLAGYKQKEWNGGLVWYEDEYPNLLFARDGDIFTMEGTRHLVIGGAYSVDKYYRLENDLLWFADEQPSAEIKTYVEDQITKNRIDIVLSHTCPYKYEPRDAFLPMIDQSTVDDSTERWLDGIEEKVDYKAWLCGHWHIEKQIDKLRFLFHDVVSLEMIKRGFK